MRHAVTAFLGILCGLLTVIPTAVEGGQGSDQYLIDQARTFLILCAARMATPGNPVISWALRTQLAVLVAVPVCIAARLWWDLRAGW